MQEENCGLAYLQAMVKVCRVFTLASLRRMAILCAATTPLAVVGVGHDLSFNQ